MAVEEKARVIEAEQRITYLCPSTMEGTGQHLLTLKVMRVSVSKTHMDSVLGRLIMSAAR
jgi:hypothetical protein